MLINTTFYSKIINERDKNINECRFNKMSVFRVNMFEFDVNDSIFSGNEQQKVYMIGLVIRYYPDVMHTMSKMHYHRVFESEG